MKQDREPLMRVMQRMWRHRNKESRELTTGNDVEMLTSALDLQLAEFDRRLAELERRK